MPQRIGIIFPGHRTQTLVHAVAGGIGEWTQGRCDWHFDFFEIGSDPLKMPENVTVAGAIAIALADDEAYLPERFLRRSIPIVHIGEFSNVPALHQVVTPNRAIGAKAAAHLLEQGLRHFAFVGFNTSLSQGRCQGFVGALAEAGFHDVPTFEGTGSTLDPMATELIDFLTKLPKPAGIMGCSDRVALQVLSSAMQADIRVPDELAVIGVDDEEMWCSLATPPLSSIRVSAKTLGQRAAAMLDDLLHGRPAPLTVQVLPMQVVERQSTAIIHAQTPEITQAIRFIRQQYSHGIAVHDAAKAAGISRSTLERGVRQALGRAPFQEILRLRLDAAKELLANTDMPMKIIATRCGFSDNKYFATHFRTATGLTPTQFRYEQRGYTDSNPKP